MPRKLKRFRVVKRPGAKRRKMRRGVGGVTATLENEPKSGQKPVKVIDLTQDDTSEDEVHVVDLTRESIGAVDKEEGSKREEHVEEEEDGAESKEDEVHHGDDGNENALEEDALKDNGFERWTKRLINDLRKTHLRLRGARLRRDSEPISAKLSAKKTQCERLELIDKLAKRLYVKPGVKEKGTVEKHFKLLGYEMTFGRLQGLTLFEIILLAPGYVESWYGSEEKDNFAQTGLKHLYWWVHQYENWQDVLALSKAYLELLEEAKTDCANNVVLLHLRKIWQWDLANINERGRKFYC